MYKTTAAGRSSNFLMKTRRHLQVDARQPFPPHLPLVSDRNELPIVSPKPVFNYKERLKSTGGQKLVDSVPQLSQNHVDMIRFVQSSWTQIMEEYKSGTNNVVYYCQTSNAALNDFQPFDLEEWWGRRLLQTMNIDPSALSA